MPIPALHDKRAIKDAFFLERQCHRLSLFRGTKNKPTGLKSTWEDIFEGGAQETEQGEDVRVHRQQCFRSRQVGEGGQKEGKKHLFTITKAASGKQTARKAALMF